ncbi:MAG TPA: phosphomannomutase/phosphoglucomutase [Planctomycetota bacterium]|nr:phosphomannomutase/phosphoglucomutase [Planctomycetota bacterium]
MSIFKAYDVRGLYGSELNEALARKIGAAFVRVTGAKSLVVGRDMRESAPKIADAFIDGAARSGAAVTRIGLASTPMTYFAIGKLGVDGGAQVTASHNPGPYIGFKFTRKGCVPMSGETGIKDIERLVNEGIEVPNAAPAPVKDVDLLEAYAEHVLTFGPGIRRMKVVIDCGNGMGGHTVPPILARLPLDAERLFFDLDGRFPNHEANPIKRENIEHLIGRVKATRADLGIAFDGDADRCVFVDERGEPVPSDAITTLFAQSVLRKERGARIVYDLRSTRATADVIRELGGVPIRERVGHSFIKATMRREGAALGGELSGHYYFRDHYYSDSGEIAMVLLLSILSESAAKLSELVAPTRRYVSTGEINFHVEDKDGVLRALKERFRDGEVDELDGVTVQYRDWWFNVRKSNTEPLLRLNLEASAPALLEEKKRLLTPMLGTPE